MDSTTPSDPTKSSQGRAPSLPALFLSVSIFLFLMHMYESRFTKDTESLH